MTENNITMKYITDITFDAEDYGKFLNVKMRNGKAVLWISKHCQSGSYNLEIKEEGHWVLPIEGRDETKGQKQDD